METFPLSVLRYRGGLPLEIVVGRMREGGFPEHTHEFTEMVVVLGGTAVHRTPEEDYPLRTGDVFVINPGAVHGFAEIRNLVQCHLSFDPKALLSPAARHLRKLPGYHALFVLERQAGAENRFRSRFRLTTAQLAEVRAMVDRMKTELEQAAPGHETVVLGLFLQLAGLVCRAYGNQGMPARAAAAPLHRLATTVGFMESNFTRPLRLPELARMSGLSVSQFSRLFRHHYDTSPVDYLIRLRIEHACVLLRDPRRTITQAAFESGFCDSNYFYRQFRRVMGRGAREFRRSLGAA